MIRGSILNQQFSQPDVLYFSPCQLWEFIGLSGLDSPLKSYDCSNDVSYIDVNCSFPFLFPATLCCFPPLLSIFRRVQSNKNNVFLFPLDIVPTVYARKPQVITRYVLPLLWNLLNANNGSAGAGNSALKTSTTRLTNTLYSCMGRTLTEQASGQVPRIQDKIHQIIGSWHPNQARMVLGTSS